MKLIRANGRGYTIHLSHREKRALFETIALYPLVPETYQQLNENIQDPKVEESQRLLHDALAEHRAENRSSILRLLKRPRRFRKKKPGFEVTFKRPELEWLLQVINDVRVGSWLALGEPEQGSFPALTQQNFQHFVAMEVCGAFESLFLSALGVTASSKWME